MRDLCVIWILNRIWASLIYYNASVLDELFFKCTNLLERYSKNEWVIDWLLISVLRRRQWYLVISSLVLFRWKARYYWVDMDACECNNLRVWRNFAVSSGLKVNDRLIGSILRIVTWLILPVTYACLKY